MTPEKDTTVASPAPAAQRAKPAKTVAAPRKAAPRVAPKAAEPALAQPLSLTATPQEFDTGFIDALRGFREVRQSLAQQAEATKEVIEAADEHRMAMVFTSVRHFRH